MKKSKYGSRKTTIDGIRFDSVKEARRYSDLKLMEKTGEISGLELQKKFVLIPSQYSEIGGKRKCIERECAYIADFVYYRGGKMVVEDAKGFRTPEYIIKRKLMLFIHGIRVQEV